MDNSKQFSDKRKILIKHGTAIPMTGDRNVIKDALIAVEGDEILYIGESNNAPPCFKEKNWANEEIDAADMVAMPGLINTHSHAPMSLLRGYADDVKFEEWLFEKVMPVEEHLNSEDIYWGSLLAGSEMLMSGITCFCDMYENYWDVARAVKDIRMRAVITPGIFGSVKEVGEQLDSAIKHALNWQGKGYEMTDLMLSAHAVYSVKPDALEVVVEKARSIGSSIHIHLSETIEEVDECKKKYGLTPIKLVNKICMNKCRILGAHCVNVNNEDIEIMANNRFSVAHCPTSNLKLACGIAPIVKMKAKNVNISIGTDGPASANQLNLWNEIRLMALLQRFIQNDLSCLNAYDALKAATVGGAKALGLDSKIGSLEKGKKADIILINLNRPGIQPENDIFSLLCYSALPQDVSTVIINGEVVVRDGRLLSIDVDEVISNANRCAKALFKRVQKNI